LASHSLSDPSRRITRIVFSIHSSGFDAKQYFENARAAASRVRGALAETRIIAPQLFEQNAIAAPIPEGMLFWRVSPFRGSSLGGIGPDANKVSISAFEVLDDWLNSLTDPNLFPQLQNIVLVGHSGGGQFVQRYAMVGKFEPRDKVTLRFVVSAPSSYVYPSAERFQQRTNRFAVPDDTIVKQCPKYNDWGYGLATPYAYFSEADPDAIAKRYAERNVFYLCGGNDNDPNDNTIGKNCGAMMQGRHRLERMQVFAAYLGSKYGRSIHRTHKFAVVQGVGHYGKGTMTSSHGVTALFAPIR
jgi:pimeloyl-ACP methyl ester carboxylesterase